jgi:hypothetical protein
MTLRKAIGILGIVLPFVCVIGSSVLSQCTCFEGSVSFYYYTKMGGFLTGTLCSLGIFLLSYNGYNTWDKIVSKTAGLFAILIALFPAKGPAVFSACDIIDRHASAFSDTVHSVACALFFVDLICMSLFLFTKDDGNPMPKKLKRNIVYKICGYVMLASVILLGICYMKWVPSWSSWDPILVFETVALIAFGVSWLTKGQGILKD